MAMPDRQIDRARLLAAGLRAMVAERERWLLWSPVLVGAGIAFYFALPEEPPPYGGALAAVLLLAAAYRARAGMAVALLAASLIALGFAATQFRSYVVAAPVLDGRYGPAPVIGTVVRLESLPRGPRATLEEVELRGIAARDTPERVRIALRKGDAASLGDRIDVFARIEAPGAPVMPGAYDFGRRAWFERLGATGFALGFSSAAAPPESRSAWLKVRISLAKLRREVSTRIRTVLPSESGTVAAALITGDRSAISSKTLDAMRDSGLAHLLAISGLHLGLVAAILFFGARTVLALSEPLSLRHPIKKWAAAIAIAGSFIYLMMAGATIPTQRAFVMTGLVLLAVIVDREAISMRLVAWAAMLILLTTPESLLSASFQMSFAAVVALVAFYESFRTRLRAAAVAIAGRPGGRIALYVAGVAVTTLIASAATGLIGLHHFGRLAVFGLPANLLAVPLTALWIMPWAVVAMILMPLGLESWGLLPMGWGIDALLEIAGSISAWPGAVRHVPSMATPGLAAAALGGLWLALWLGRWRYLGLAGIVAGIAAIPLTPRPDILIADSGRLMAVRLSDGALSLSSSRLERYAADLWLESVGQVERRYWPSPGITQDGRLACDPLGCVYRLAGKTVALIRDGRALAEECRVDGILISTVPVRGRCPGPSLVIDRFDLWRSGAHALWLGGRKPVLRTVRDHRGHRPWSRWPAEAARKWSRRGGR